MTTLQTEIDHHPLRLRWEAIAASLLAAGRAGEIVALPIGADQAPVGPDVQGVETDGATLLFSVARDGTYERLLTLLRKDEDLIWKKNSEREAWEELDDYRDFFKNSDLRLSQLSLELELMEHGASGLPPFARRMADFWGVGAVRGAEQLLLLLGDLPNAPLLVADWPKVGALATLVLDVPVRFRPSAPVAENLLDDLLPDPWQDDLEGALIGGERVCFGYPAVRVTIGPLPAARAESFLKGNASDAMLGLLCDLFVPLGTDVVREYLGVRSDGGETGEILLDWTFS